MLVSGESCGAGTFHSAGLLGVAFVWGTAAANVCWLAQREDALLPANKVLNADGTINIAKIDAAKRKLVQSLMMQEEGVTVGIYEEMLAILQNVQDPKAMFDAEFIVMDNNAFPAYVPNCIPAEDAEALYKAYESEKTELGSAEVLSYYYAAVRTLDERYYVALFNRHKGENIRSIGRKSWTKAFRRDWKARRALRQGCAIPVQKAIRRKRHF